jgi:hypothetical protein
VLPTTGPGGQAFAAVPAELRPAEQRGAESAGAGDESSSSTSGRASSARPAQTGRLGENPAGPPADSGTGRRIVFDAAAQRVWLVSRRGTVQRTYPVSGSVTDNLAPGRYSVYSKSRHAVGVDDSGTMQYMVRFARGARAAIGFHDIPVLDGRPVQRVEDLGTAKSHGCIRQARPDAMALWEFAQIGTEVVVST